MKKIFYRSKYQKVIDKVNKGKDGKYDGLYYILLAIFGVLALYLITKLLG